MDPIFKLKTGAYIDLDKLYCISESRFRFEYAWSFYLYFEFSRDPLIINRDDLRHEIDGDIFPYSEQEFEEYREELIRQWIKYKNERAKNIG